MQTQQGIVNWASEYIRVLHSPKAHCSKRLSEIKECQEYCNVEPHKILGVSKSGGCH